MAKKGAAMQAIGVGQCDLHCVDNLVNPCILTLKDVLCISEASKLLISVSMLSRDGSMHFSSTDPVFPPGVYQPSKNARLGKSNKTSIPLQCINDLYTTSVHEMICIS